MGGLFFLGDDTRTEEKKMRDLEICELLKRYETKFNEQISTECLQMSDEELIVDLRRCLKENIRLEVIHPGINDYDEDDDL